MLKGCECASSSTCWARWRSLSVATSSPPASVLRIALCTMVMPEVSSCQTRSTISIGSSLPLTRALPRLRASGILPLRLS